MKRVYVANIQWKENGRWYNTSLHAFSNRRAAQSYVETKQLEKATSPANREEHYFIQELTCWSFNFLKEE